MDKLQQILADLQIAAQTLAGLGIPEASAAAQISVTLLAIAQTAIKAHQDIVGEPLDLNLLQPID